MRRRSIVLFVGSAALVAAGFTYLVLTGERGLSPRSQPARSLDISRLSADVTKSLGWNAGRLDDVFNHAATLSTDSFMIVTKDQVVGAFGDLKEPYRTHSIRKSFLSALVGRHVGSGPRQIPLEATLQQLAIDDTPGPLTALQKQAKVLHLLKSMSGINHPAAAAGGLVADNQRRLGSAQNEPGTVWAYSNWDYNTLTTIFETRTGLKIGEAFQNEIARPTEMEDYTAAAVSYISAPNLSRHKAAAFRMSARDLAKFGQLYLNRGKTKDQQVIPASWVDRATTDFSKTGRDDLRWGHGYLWWIPSPKMGLPKGSFWAWGLGNQAIFVIPAWDTVIVHQSDTTEFLKRFIPIITNEGLTGEAAIEKLILSCRTRADRKSEFCVEHRFTTRREFEKLVSLIAKARR